MIVLPALLTPPVGVFSGREVGVVGSGGGKVTDRAVGTGGLMAVRVGWSKAVGVGMSVGVGINGACCKLQPASRLSSVSMDSAG